MFKTSSILAAIFAVALLSHANAQDYSFEVIDEAPEADEVADEIAQLIADKGVRIKRGSTRTVCELWLCKQWTVDADFEATDERLYPFTPGQLVGLLHFSRRGSEFRDQTISSGWYTLRFALQPVDGNHEGTSPTRDFFLLVNAEDDDLADNWEMDALNESSAEAAGSSHPAMLCLQRATEGSEMALRHDEQHDWWVLHLVGTGTSGDKTIDIPIDLVVVGHAEE